MRGLILLTIFGGTNVSALVHAVLKTSIRTRLIIYFIFSVLIPTSMLAVTIYHKSSDIITSKIDQLIEKNLNTAEVSILQKFEAADDIATLISFNSRLLEIFAAPKPQGPTSIVEEMNNLNHILESYYLSNLSNFTKTTLFPKIYMLNRREYKGYKISDKVFDISEIENESWYKSFSTGVVTVVGLDKTQTLINTIDSIKIARKLYDIKPSDAKYSALLTIDIETNYFINILESIKASANRCIHTGRNYIQERER